MTTQRTRSNSRQSSSRRPEDSSPSDTSQSLSAMFGAVVPRADRQGETAAARRAPPGQSDLAALVARGLGMFSLALGASQLAIPGQVARAVGVRDDDRTRLILRLLGARELASGVGLLVSRRPSGWLWGRVAGDAMDLSLHGAALASDATRCGRGADRTRALVGLAALIGLAAVDVWCALRQTLAPPASQARTIEVRRSVTIARPPTELYRSWRDLERLPRIMRHLDAVRVTADRRSHWTAKAPGGLRVEWDAELVEERPNELIAWRSLPGTAVPNEGAVRFVPAPGGRGTEVHVYLRYEPPAGRLGKVVAQLLGEEPDQQVSDDLRRFKQLMEAGEITRSDAATTGTRLRQRPAQPAGDASAARAEV